MKKVLKNKFIRLTLIAILLLSVWLTYQKFRPKDPTKLYELAPAGLSDIRQTVVASGKIKSQTQADLKFSASGLIAWIGVKEGDRVKKWQALASLDVRELQMNLEKYLLDFSKERNDFDEDIKVTYRDKALTDTISRILQKNQYDLDKAVLDVELKDLSLKLATLISPIDGIITNLDTPVAGVNVLSTTPIFTVADPDNLIFEAEIDESDIAKLTVGQEAVLLLDAYPEKPLTLTVSTIDFHSSLDSAGSTVYLVKFYLLNPDSLVYRLGMNGEITITTSQKNQVLTIPSEAINNNQVRIIENKVIKEQPVVVGIESDTLTEIVSGLTPGQLVVVANKSK